MGCDIHAYIERRYQTKTAKKEHNSWRPFGGQMRLDRNYTMFGLMAGVRDDRVTPIVAPRGRPDDLSWEANNDAFLRINDELKDHDGFVLLAKAKEWATRGEQIVELNGKPWKVSHPDWHSHSWMTADEFEAAIAAYDAHYKEPIDWIADYKAALAAMREFERIGYETRLVFWFDN